MNTALAQQLINAREDVQEKIRALKGDIEEAKRRAEAQYEPLQQQLKDISK